MNDNDEPKLMLTLEGNVIAAKEYSWLSGDLIGCAVSLTDGSKRLFAEEACPTESQFYCLDDSIHTLPFEEKKTLVLKATGLDDRDELPWLEYANDGNPIDGQIESELLEAWLSKTVDLSDPRMEYWGSHSTSQYTPGFEIMNSLDTADRRKLGLHEADLGGPASSVPCVAMTANIDEFNQIMKARGLPYVIVDDDGPIET